MKSLNVFLFLPLLIFNCSSIIKITKDPLYEKKVNFSKRIVIFSNPENKITKMENLTLVDISRDLINHHKEFIVYKPPQKFNGTCNREFSKVEGILYLTLLQNQLKNDLEIEMTASLLQCPESKSIWSVTGKRKYSLSSTENESLRNTYIQKYGLGIGNRVNPYYQIMSEIIESLESPKLNKDEEDEKIEVDST